MMLKGILFSTLILLMVATPVFGANATPGGTSQAAQEMSVELDGLLDEVTVRYDGFGIPHIYGTSDHDILMTQGYLTAQDRWWQMEWSRRQANGELSAVMGSSLVDTDLFLRTLGLRRGAEADLNALREETRAGLEAYTVGVNAWIADKDPQELAREYRFVNMMGGDMEVAPWTVLDTVAFSQALAILFEQSNLENELLKAGLIEVAGPLAPLLLMPEYNYDVAPIISEPGWQPLDEPPVASTGMEVAMATTPDLSSFRYPTLIHPMFQDIGSNSWVISGELTESGMPILANDPHISQGNPSVWYELGLHCVEMTADCTLNAYGYSLPGVPLFVIGHNDHHAWGMTVSVLDTIDIYTLELNPDDPNQYMFDGEWVDMEVITETIEVANGDPIEVEVRLTRFGPVVNHLVGFEQPLAARMMISEANTAIETFHRIIQATSWQEFQEGIALFDFAGQNFVYADVEGNIGAIAGGRIPIRVPGHDGTTPVPGTDSSFDWQGFVDGMDNPRIFNPEQGYIVAANNAFIRPDDFETVISRYYNYGQRAGRIETLIQAEDVHTIEMSIAIQNDTYDPMAPYLLPALADLELDDPDLEAARDWLLEWDGYNDADSGQAALHNAMWMYLMPLVFDELEPAGGVVGGTREMFLMRGMLAGDHPLWANEQLGINDPQEILAMALQSGYEHLVDELGPDLDSWRWDAIHISHAQNNPFGRLPAGVSAGLDVVINDIYRLFNRKIGVPGGLENVNNQRWDVRNGDFYLDGAIVSMRMVVDFSDFNNSRFIHELGQRGDPLGEHFEDMSELWATGQYHPYGFTPDAIEAMTEQTLILTPR